MDDGTLTRNTTTTQGKKISFYVDRYYYTPERDKRLIFRNTFEKTKYCVAYTAVKEVEVSIFTRHSKGLIGYQNLNFFDNKEDALEDFKARKKLSPKPKVSTKAYADVFFIENKREYA